MFKFLRRLFDRTFATHSPSKSMMVEGEESDLDSVIASIKRVYKGESTGGIINIGFAFINICETACIDISEVIE